MKFFKKTYFFNYIITLKQSRNKNCLKLTRLIFVLNVFNYIQPYKSRIFFDSQSMHFYSRLLNVFYTLLDEKHNHAASLSQSVCDCENINRYKSSNESSLLNRDLTDCANFIYCFRKDLNSNDLLPILNCYYHFRCLAVSIKFTIVLYPKPKNNKRPDFSLTSITL